MDSLMTEMLDAVDLSDCDDQPVIRRTVGEAGRAAPGSPLDSTLHRLCWAIAARDVVANEAVEAIQTFAPGPTSDTVCASNGNVLALPQGWTLLPPGDPALTRRVKAAGDHWIIWEKKGRKVLSRGVCAAATIIDRIRAELEAERANEGCRKKMTAKANSSGSQVDPASVS